MDISPKAAALIITGFFLTFGVFMVWHSDPMNGHAAYASATPPPPETPSDVTNSPWDMSVSAVKDYLAKNLNDADSIQYVEWSKVQDNRPSGIPYPFMVRCKYRAKNAFGAYVLKNQIFGMDTTGKVVHVADWF